MKRIIILIVLIAITYIAQSIHNLDERVANQEQEVAEQIEIEEINAENLFD